MPATTTKKTRINTQKKNTHTHTQKAGHQNNDDIMTMVVITVHYNDDELTTTTSTTKVLVAMITVASAVIC